jgi:sulfur carrier protein
MKVSVNGEYVELPAAATVSVLLEQLKLFPDRVAVEMDKQIVRRSDWDRAEIPTGASLEVVQFIGGG